MATQYQTPAIIQNENLHINKGKGEAIEPPKKKKGLKDGRKALADLSKKPPPTQKPPLSSKGAANPKGKPSVPRGGPVYPPGMGSLTDEEIRRCREWAKEGIEHVHFTGNDARKLEREIQEERVRKEVEMVMSSLWSWSQMAFDSFFVTRESAGDLEDVTRLELDPEVDLPLSKSSFFSGNETEDPLPEDEHHMVSVMDYAPIELKLKDSDDEMP